MLTPTRALKLSIPIAIVLVVSVILAVPFTSELLAEHIERFDFGGKLDRLKWSQEEVIVGRRDCTMSGVAPELVDRIGDWRVVKSQAYLGTGYRMKRFLDKAKRGEGFTVGVIGGSVSYGHGLTPAYRAYHKVMFDHLDALFPANGTTIGGTCKQGTNCLINGGVPATGSDYFEYCFQNHIPDETDLVLLELGINDELQVQRFESYEVLLRGLLDMPNQPAIISMQVFALVFGTIATGGDFHHGAAQYYDVPTISLRNALLPDILANHTVIGDWFAWNKEGPDPRHIGPNGHQLLGDLGVAYIDSQLCEKERGQVHEETMPRLRVMSPYRQDEVTPPITPFCHSTNTEGRNKLKALKADGWEEITLNNKNYITSDVPGSTVEFEFTTTLGSVDLYYLRAKGQGLGDAKCWVDEDKGKAVTLRGHWGLSYNIGQ